MMSSSKKWTSSTLAESAWSRAQDGMINTVVDLNNELASGMYMVQITAGDEVFSQRVVIQK
ncbi:MAG: T9SS type A sorting domain-containing protein [Flavobacteriales bacterium]|nr:T9SS type A sorting domain-containing protein [Flavobacteriales bacterium]